jgi:hypothetical protein
MRLTSLLLAASFCGSALAAPTQRRYASESQAECTDFYADITASAVNFDIAAVTGGA